MPRWMRGAQRSLKSLMMILRPLLMEPKRSIIETLSHGAKGTNEIYAALQERGLSMPRSTLYYHLSTLEEAGIIEMAGYREKGGGAPEKIWKLKVRKIGIDLTTGQIFKK